MEITHVTAGHAHTGHAASAPPQVVPPSTPKTPEPVVDVDKKKEVPPPPCNIVIERGVDGDKVAMPFKFFRILKGKRADTFYPAPEVTTENLAQIEKWIGIPNLINQIQTNLKRIMQVIASQSINSETGMFDEALFTKYATDFTTTGMKLKDINLKLDELQAQLSRMIDTGLWLTDEKAKKELTVLNEQVRAYRQMRDDKQRKPVADEDEEEQPSVLAGEAAQTTGV